MNEGWYYLHSNGSLIYKRTWPGEDGSDLVRHIWPCDPSNRLHAWTIVLEGLSLGADLDRVKELASKWGCTLQDFVEYLSRAPQPSPTLRDGAVRFLKQIAGVDDHAFWDWLGATPKGQQPDWSKTPAALTPDG